MIGLVLAAGAGRRLRPDTNALPKALLPVAGPATILDIALRNLAAVGLSEVVIVVGHAAQAIGDRAAALERAHRVRLTLVPNDRALDWNNAYSLDCADGELARWSGRTSATGVYLDGIGHYLGESALLAGLGIRAQGQLALAGGYVTAGLAAALLAVLVKAETDNVTVARAKAGLPGAHDGAALAPRAPGLARARRLTTALRVHRAIQAVELSGLILVAAVIDALRGGLAATRALTVACLVIAGILVPAHLAAIGASRRLR